MSCTDHVVLHEVLTTNEPRVIRVSFVYTFVQSQIFSVFNLDKRFSGQRNS